jgi:hypothetical protein
MRYAEGVRCKPICTGLGNITDEIKEECKCDEDIGYYISTGKP